VVAATIRGSGRPRTSLIVRRGAKGLS